MKKKEVCKQSDAQDESFLNFLCFILQRCYDWEGKDPNECFEFAGGKFSLFSANETEVEKTEQTENGTKKKTEIFI